MITDEEKEKHKAFIRGLFFASEDGALEQFIHDAARRWSKNAKQEGKIQDNLYDATDFFKFAANLRDIAARALPNGVVMGVTRAEVAEYLGTPGEIFDWFRFSGLNKSTL